MSLRALGSLLTRRVAPRGISRAQAESSLGIGINKAPGSSAGIQRDLAFGDGSYGAGPAGAADVAAFGGFIALLYFNKDTEKSVHELHCPPVLVSSEVSSVEAPMEVAQVVKEDLDEEAIKAKFVDNDGKVKDLKVDEEAMHARFEDWMKQYGRSYKSEEEKALRYEIFKETALDCDRRGACFSTGDFADWTDEEWNQMGCSGNFDHEKYSADIKALIAEGRERTLEDFRAEWRARNTKDVSDEAIKN